MGEKGEERGMEREIQSAYRTPCDVSFGVVINWITPHSLAAGNSVESNKVA